MSAKDDLFLGIDLSTQQLKGIVLNGDNEVVYTHAVNFQNDLARFGTSDGIIRDPDGRTVSSPVAMWLAAIDMLLENLKTNVELGKIKGLSGCAQQHGTVYWNKQGILLLQRMNESSTFEESLREAFSRQLSPIWMDSSTGRQCKELEDAVGGAEALTSLTGSRAHHRFSGSQIKKIHDTEQEIWSQTEYVSVISSFVCSLFVGKLAPVDYTDGSGMNLMDIQKDTWSDFCLSVIDDPSKMKQKLGVLANPAEVLGSVSTYLVQKYGFNKDCIVLPFLGDNPASLAGLSISSDVGVSLGTSDTVFFSTPTYSPCIDAHVFSHFNGIKGDYMGLVCFKNGSLTRERIRKMIKGSWEEFGAILKKTPVGNDGCIGFFFDSDEIAPNVEKGDRLYRNGQKVTEFSAEKTARALFESQCLLKRVYCEKMGKELGKGRLLVTGGASVNVELRQMLADVFGMEVFTINVPDSAALGGAMRARYAFYKPSLSYEEYYSNPSISLAAVPNLENHRIYSNMLPMYKQCLADLLNN